ncbi:MAG TPA: FAD:protein FMN transferase [Longimicrobiales bacterium]|nr:FAD:protein FMN transferase [Longimicrobiales bacterium]
MITILSLALASLIVSTPADRPCAGAERVERSAYVMGTVLRMEIAGADRACAVAAAEAALAEVERLEGVLSSWRADSELGRLNSVPAGTAGAPSAELDSLLGEAHALHVATGGAFDPAVGALIDAWDLRGTGRVPTAAELAAAGARSGLANCFEPVTWVRLWAGCWLDSGAFGKGAALRAALRVLAAHGVSEAVLDFGGQVAALGPAAIMAVAHPAERARPVHALRVRNASLSTTSQSERFIESGAERYGHVLDPRTGRPVPAWGSVTVLAADALTADALSTALFVMGPEAALAWARARADVGVLVLRVAGGVVVASWNAALEPFLVPITTVHSTSEESL